MLSTILSFICLAWASAADSSPATIRVVAAGKTYVGRPLAWDQQLCMLLRRDGRISQLKIAEVQQFEMLSDGFHPYDPQTLAQRLARQFGTGYEVSVTEHFVVAHPRGERVRWAEPFERLYGQFVHYYRVRDFAVEQPEFPLVVIVLRSREEFQRSAADDGVAASERLDGYYSPQSNRVVTFDSSAGQPDGRRDLTDMVLVHEAQHQFAFNTGIHSRWSLPPKWATEGLACMFEARGVYDSLHHQDPRDRVHARYLADLRQLIDSGKTRGRLSELVQSDRLFESNPALAYPLAWGMVFYFAETQPRELFGYLQKTSRRPSFSSYESAERLRDFATHFGADLSMIQHRLETFIQRK